MRSVPSTRVRISGNEQAGRSRALSRRSASRTDCRIGVGLAGGRRRAARVLGRRRQVRRGPAPRHRRRAGRGAVGACARRRGGDLRRLRSDARAHRDDPRGGRASCIAHAPRLSPREEGCPRGRGRSDRPGRPIWGTGALCSLRAPGRPRRRRSLRGPAVPAPVAECLPPSPGIRAAARTSSRACVRPCAAPGRSPRQRSPDAGSCACHTGRVGLIRAGGSGRSGRAPYGGAGDDVRERDGVFVGGWHRRGRRGRASRTDTRCLRTEPPTSESLAE